ncbi:hypothetical protein FEM48_Zijuj06G0118100 [Ziziphus jujuba var. spinosa]|uniref:Uncharacterized protein n=1 Tax=Ziziphus jujuba var. spinosa TaxID=714518 RepID=A0A978V943_ZIZJJ|nr:hypothetical protein FEM48_Zijuj06G0118100 [Ziziphus jujuba var. spinosa]
MRIQVEIDIRNPMLIDFFHKIGVDRAEIGGDDDARLIGERVGVTKTKEDRDGEREPKEEPTRIKEGKFNLGQDASAQQDAQRDEIARSNGFSKDRSHSN